MTYWSLLLLQTAYDIVDLLLEWTYGGRYRTHSAPIQVWMSLCLYSAFSCKQTLVWGRTGAGMSERILKMIVSTTLSWDWLKVLQANVAMEMVCSDTRFLEEGKLCIVCFSIWHFRGVKELKLWCTNSIITCSKFPHSRSGIIRV